MGVLPRCDVLRSCHAWDERRAEYDCCLAVSMATDGRGPGGPIIIFRDCLYGRRLDGTFAGTGTLFIPGL